MNFRRYQFISYAGDPEIHDGVITDFQYLGTMASVKIKTHSGRILTVEFEGVTSIETNRPVGMVLYALCEMWHVEHRLFVFGNWDDNDDAYLEITADGFTVR